MTSKTYTFENCRIQDGVLFLGFKNTKHGMSFDSRPEILRAIKEALAKDREHQMYIALAKYIEVNGINAPISGLNGISFTADDGNF